LSRGFEFLLFSALLAKILKVLEDKTARFSHFWTQIW